MPALLSIDISPREISPTAAIRILARKLGVQFLYLGALELWSPGEAKARLKALIAAGGEIDPNDALNRAFMRHRIPLAVSAPAAARLECAQAALREIEDLGRDAGMCGAQMEAIHRLLMDGLETGAIAAWGIPADAPVGTKGARIARSEFDGPRRIEGFSLVCALTGTPVYQHLCFRKADVDSILVAANDDLPPILEEKTNECEDVVAEPGAILPPFNPGDAKTDIIAEKMKRQRDGAWTPSQRWLFPWLKARYDGVSRDDARALHREIWPQRKERPGPPPNSCTKKPDIAGVSIGRPPNSPPK